MIFSETSLDWRPFPNLIFLNLPTSLFLFKIPSLTYRVYNSVPDLFSSSIQNEWRPTCFWVLPRMNKDLPFLCQNYVSYRYRNLQKICFKKMLQDIINCNSSLLLTRPNKNPGSVLFSITVAECNSTLISGFTVSLLTRRYVVILYLVPSRIGLNHITSHTGVCVLWSSPQASFCERGDGLHTASAQVPPRWPSYSGVLGASIRSHIVSLLMGLWLLTGLPLCQLLMVINECCLVK